MSRKANRNTVDPGLGERLGILLDKRQLTQSRFAELIGVKQGHVSDWIRGRSRPSKSTRKLIAVTLGINEKWLTEGSGPIYKQGAVGEQPQSYQKTVPLLGRGRGRGDFSEDGFPVGHGLPRIPIPFDVRDPRAFAVVVRGDSMSPRYEDRDVVLCSPQKGWRSGDYCVIVKKDNEVFVKKVKDVGEHLILSSLAPTRDPIMIHKSEIRAVHKIVWKKER